MISIVRKYWLVIFFSISTSFSPQVECFPLWTKYFPFQMKYSPFMKYSLFLPTWSIWLFRKFQFWLPFLILTFFKTDFTYFPKMYYTYDHIQKYWCSIHILILLLAGHLIRFYNIFGSKMISYINSKIVNIVILDIS